MATPGNSFLIPSAVEAELFNLLRVPPDGLLVLSAQPAKLCAVDLTLASYRQLGVRLVVSLLPGHEMATLGLQSLGQRCEAADMAWANCPIDDFAHPGPEFEKQWQKIARALHAFLNTGQGVALHCRAGLGRTGTVAARILIERGMSAALAIQLVRQARPGSIETASQEDYLRHLAMQPDIASRNLA